jgi:indole-3-glycerol phosphate synthase
VREARAFGADAILLMASVLDAARLKGFHELALELGGHAAHLAKRKPHLAQHARQFLRPDHDERDDADNQ